jgi:hypothetical protein
MMAEMSSHLLSEWMAYNQLEPFGAELIDMHFARLQAQLASSKNDLKNPQKFRLWEKIAEFDAQGFFNELKSLVSTKKE